MGSCGRENGRKGEVSGLESEDMSVNPSSTTLIPWLCFLLKLIALVKVQMRQRMREQVVRCYFPTERGTVWELKW